MTRYLLLIALVLTGSRADCKPEDATATQGTAFNFKFRHRDDRAQVSQTSDSTVLRITSPGGIGDVEVSLKEGTWPRRITLVLELHNLESFGVGNGQLDLGGSLRAAGEQGLLCYNERGERTEDAKQAVHTIKLTTRVEKQQRLIELTLPPHFCTKGTKTLKVSWIDAFRR